MRYATFNELTFSCFLSYRNKEEYEKVVVSKILYRPLTDCNHLFNNPFHVLPISSISYYSKRKRFS
jgi:hypothetical protein